MEGAISFDGARGVIVDAFAWAGEESGGGVAIIHDEIGVGFVALKGDADDHLSEGGAGERISATEGLGAEDDMDAKGAALADDAVEEEGGGLGDGIVIDKKLLKFVDEEEGTREGFGATGASISGEVLDAEFAKKIPAAFEFIVDALEDAEGEFAITFDGDDAGVGEAFFGVAFEFDAFFEIDEIELYLIGGAGEGEVGDDDMEEGGFAGTGFAGEEGVLAGAFSDGEVLEFGGAGSADGDFEFLGGVVGPVGFWGWSDLAEGDFDAIGVDAGFADEVGECDGEIGVGLGVEREEGADRGLALGEGEDAIFAVETEGSVAEFMGGEAIGERLSLVPMNEGKDAAARSA